MLVSMSDKLVSMSDKKLKRLSVLQEVYDRRITQSKASQLLKLSDRQIRRLIQGYKAQGPVALAHTHRGQPSNSKLSEEIRIQCLSIVSEQLYGFGPTLAHEKLTTVHGFNISVETLRCWMIAADLWIPRSKRMKRPYQSRYNRDCFGELIQIDGFEGRATINAVCWYLLMMRPVNYSIYVFVKQNQPLTICLQHVLISNNMVSLWPFTVINILSLESIKAVNKRPR